MLRKKMISIGKLGRKAKSTNATHDHSYDQQSSTRESLLEAESKSSNSIIPSDSPVLSSSPSNKSTPSGFFAIYVGEEKERFVVPTSFLSHPLFKILLEKAYDEFGFEQTNGLVLPCTVSTFQEVVDAVEGCHGRFDVAKLLEEFD